MTTRADVSQSSRVRGARIWVEYALVVAIIVAGTFITWVRVAPDGRRRVWAEDANLFLTEAIGYGPWDVIFRGYAGYQHLVPRLVTATIYPWFDIVVFPMLLFIICAALTGLVAAAVFWLSRDLVPWLPARLLLAGVTLYLPLAAQETIGNLADLHAYAMWLAPWLLLYRPRRWATGIGWAIVTFLVVMTEIQAVFFIWLIFFRLGRANARSYPIYVAFIAGSVGQVITALTIQRTTSNGPLSVPSTVMGWIVNTVFPLVNANPEQIRQLIRDSGLLVGLLLLVPIVIAAVYVLWRGSGAQRLLVVACLLGSAATYTGSAWSNSSEWFEYAEVGLANIDHLAINIRYGVSAGMLLVAVVPVALSLWVTRTARAQGAAKSVPRVVGVVISLAILAVMVHASTDTYSLRTTVDEWPASVQNAIAGCRDGVAPDPVTLPVAPSRSMDISCANLLELARH
ncbi:hypothetical protein [uncultured Microbacterium sp.]|uniref:hypothetical protein n=1 Tax=uncultured Microbacterium sp. TaxID=191216 RepID=UPI0025F0B42F|nr:hypothetical protein [uncultured Microbacterium sp.]